MIPDFNGKNIITVNDSNNLTSVKHIVEFKMYSKTSDVKLNKIMRKILTE